MFGVWRSFTPSTSVEMEPLTFVFVTRSANDDDGAVELPSLRATSTNDYDIRRCDDGSELLASSQNSCHQPATNRLS